MYLASRCQAQPHWAPQQARPPGGGSPGSGGLRSGRAVGSVSTRARPGVWCEAALPTGRVSRYLRVSLSSLPTPACTRVLVPRGHVGIGRHRGREEKKWLRINGATQRGLWGARDYSADGVRSGREQEPSCSIEKGRRQGPAWEPALGFIASLWLPVFRALPLFQLTYTPPHPIYTL